MDFDAWYIEHFGNRPSKLSLHELRSRMLEARSEYERLDDLWDKTYMWEVNKEAAKQAWNERRRD